MKAQTSAVYSLENYREGGEKEEFFYSVSLLFSKMYPAVRVDRGAFRAVARRQRLNMACSVLTSAVFAICCLCR